MESHFVINLGRQLGSGGKEIGERLAKDLHIAFYDKELINLASEESGLCREFSKSRRESFTNHFRRTIWYTLSFCHRRSLSV